MTEQCLMILEKTGILDLANELTNEFCFGGEGTLAINHKLLEFCSEIICYGAHYKNNVSA